MPFFPTTWTRSSSVRLWSFASMVASFRTSLTTHLPFSPSNSLSGNRGHPVLNLDGKDDGNQVMVYKASDITAHEDLGLTRGGFILIGLLSGGDYHPGGLPGCGPKIALGLARAGLGDSLLKATQTLTEEQLPDFLDSWRTDLRTELRTNASGFLGKKCAALSKSVPDDFPTPLVLRSYTHPITTESEAKRKGTRPKIIGWGLEPNVGKLAALCELYFEWGVRDVIIKRFRTVLWPALVLRILRKMVLDQDHDEARTPKTMLAEEELTPAEMLVKIHSSRRHATTGKLLEYRLEVAPAQLVSLANDGVKGTRLPPEADSAYDLTEDEDDEGRTGKKTPPEPNAPVRIWLPACMIEGAHPELVRAFEGKEADKLAKKSTKGKGRSASAAPASPKKRKPKAFPMALSQESPTSENEAAPPLPLPAPTKPASRRKTPTPSGSQTSRVAALFTDGPSSSKIPAAIREEEEEPSDTDIPPPRLAPFPLDTGEPSKTSRAFSRTRSSPAVLPSPPRPTRKPAPFPKLPSPPSRTRALESDSEFDDLPSRTKVTVPSFFGAQKPRTGTAASKKTSQPASVKPVSSSITSTRGLPSASTTRPAKPTYIELSDSDDNIARPAPVAPLRASSKPPLKKPASAPIVPSVPLRSKSVQRTMPAFLEKPKSVAPSDPFAMDFSDPDINYTRPGGSSRPKPTRAHNTSDDSSLGSRGASRRSHSPLDSAMRSPSSSPKRPSPKPPSPDLDPSRFSFSPPPQPTKPRNSELSIISISSEEEEISPLVRAKMNVAKKLAQQKRMNAPQRKLDAWVGEKAVPAPIASTSSSSRTQPKSVDYIDLS
jgi:Holliday junction resolvase YEN1